ncbi:MAG TPA: AarF/ABC1/UbiB kinase family protein [Kofleriaceae bacterium]|jgi:predicted unusual protein kinase regulating ubiquinone biosynthesis (AarF/ABC1/UbiB family)|nr:AarF/ABC1/UbiB kinase family protein [Kofleriaceae bacterium]
MTAEGDRRARTADRRSAERRIGWARLWARAKQIVGSDPTGSDEDDRVVDEEAARVLASNAGRLKGGLAKVAQLAAYDPGAALGGQRGASSGARAVLADLWDHAPAVSGGAIARVIAEDLGRSPEALFATWDPVPLAAASLGQVHAATLADGTAVVVKVQYPGVAEALRADLDDTAFVKKLAGSEIGRSLDDAQLHALAQAVRGELDYVAEARALERFATAWRDHPALRFPRVIGDRSSARVLTMTRARGKTVVETAATGSPDVRRHAAMAIFQFAWGSPLAHGLVNADPNPGNFLIDEAPDGSVAVWCLDFGCALELPAEVRDADREIWWGLLDDDSASAAERFRIGIARAGLLRRADTLATTAHRDWERALAAPVTAHGEFPWTARYASDLAEATGRALGAGGLVLPANVLLLWRQRLGAASVIAMLDARAPFRRVLVELIGTGRRALR